MQIRSIPITRRQKSAMRVGFMIGCAVGSVVGYLMGGDIATAVFGFLVGGFSFAGMGAGLTGPEPESQDALDFQYRLQSTIGKRLVAAVFGAIVGMALGAVAALVGYALSTEPPISVWLISSATIGALVGAIIGKSWITRV
jgi:hypothetical protein